MARSIFPEFVACFGTVGPAVQVISFSEPWIIALLVPRNREWDTPIFRNFVMSLKAPLGSPL